ncbi:MAG: hypothetical protein KQJ78_05465 [Deltaproteobacteria bacterium]|nr:hypothetical protein [Deltaproteobacteria bacterium]
MGSRDKRIRRWLILAVFAVLVVGVVVHFAPRYLYSEFGHLALSPAQDQMKPAELARLRAKLAGLQGKIAWSSSRSGNHELYLYSLPDLTLYQLTKNQFVDYFPRFSPDGRSLVFARSQKPWVSEREVAPWDTWLLDLASGREKLLVKNANMANWVDGHTILFVRGGTEVRTLDLATGQEKLLLDGGAPPVEAKIFTPMLDPRDHNLLAFTGRGRLNGVFTLNLTTHQFLGFGDGCEMGFSPDGHWVMWVWNQGQGGTSIVKSRPDQPGREVFMDLPGPYSHEYFFRLSRNMRWLVWCGSAGGHEHDIADYEVFLWNTADPPREALRLTYNPANDRWPDIHLD